jgi:hypothetical protein
MTALSAVMDFSFKHGGRFIISGTVNDTTSKQKWHSQERNSLVDCDYIVGIIFRILSI